jgi:pentose-5-phosphate-3-epimerase
MELPTTPPQPTTPAQPGVKRKAKANAKEGVILYPSKALMDKLLSEIKQINLTYRVSIRPEVALQRLLEMADDAAIASVMAAVEADVQAWKEAQKQAANMASQLFHKQGED